MKTAHALVLYEADYAPVYYFPRDEINMALLTPTDHSTWCPYKGAASYFSIISENDDVLENAVWSYGDPFEEIALTHFNIILTKPHGEGALHNKERLFSAVMLVPFKCALDLCKTHFLTIDPRRDMRRPLFPDAIKGRGDVDFFDWDFVHGTLLNCRHPSRLTRIKFG